MANTNNLSIELITDPEVIKFTLVNNGESFKGKLTSEQYAEREWTISALGNPRKLDKYLGSYHFALRDTSIKVDEDDKTGNIVSSCETNNRLAWKITPNGELKEVVSACVGSVYTIPERRGKGYASALITKLNEYWDKLLGPDGFIFLYSEVGEYYSKFGYLSHNVPTHHVKVKAEDLLDQSTESIKYLKPDDYSQAIENFKESVKKDLISKSKESDKVLVSLQPDIHSLNWFHCRDQYVLSKLNGAATVERFGASLNDNPDDLIVWLHDWSEDSLMILLFRYSNLDSFKKLFSLALQEAHDSGLHQITVWDTVLSAKGEIYTETLSHLRSFETETSEINSSLSALRLCDGSTNVDWINNEKWCWY